MALRVDQQALPLDHKYTASQYTGKSVDVYVLDTGIHYNHSVFNGRAHYPGCDPIDKLEHETREGEDCNGHGTRVAGLVGGNGRAADGLGGNRGNLPCTPPR